MTKYDAKLVAYQAYTTNLITQNSIEETYISRQIAEYKLTETKSNKRRYRSMLKTPNRPHAIADMMLDHTKMQTIART